MARTPKKVARREFFVLTPEEKRVVAFVLVMFALGLATKHYRATHLKAPVSNQAKPSQMKKPPPSPAPDTQRDD